MNLVLLLILFISRYWNLEDASSSFVVCGLEEGAPRRAYASENDFATIYQELPTSDCDASLSRVCVGVGGRVWSVFIAVIVIPVSLFIEITNYKYHYLWF